MRHSNKYVIKICIISFLGSVICMLLVYYFMPRLFCNIVYDANSNYDADDNYDESDWNQEYVETFVPTYKYIKSINIYVICEEQHENQSVVCCLTDENEKIVKECKLSLSSYNKKIQNLEFDIEKWVDISKQYRLYISLDNAEKVYIPLISSDKKNSEHISLSVNQNTVDKNMCLQYVYGTYSKKRLLLWFMAFFIALFYVCDGLVQINQKKEKK